MTIRVLSPDSHTHEPVEVGPSFQEDLKRALAARSHSIKGRRADLGDLYFRSRWEANYARYLNYLMDRDEITAWEHEPDTFWFEKIKRGVRSYLPDFKVYVEGESYYVEVKGWFDSKSKTKLKRMKIYHPGVKLKLVDEFSYKKLEKEFSGLIEGWELPPKSVRKRTVASPPKRRLKTIAA